MTSDSVGFIMYDLYTFWHDWEFRYYKIWETSSPVSKISRFCRIGWYPALSEHSSRCKRIMRLFSNASPLAYCYFFKGTYHQLQNFGWYSCKDSSRVPRKGRKCPQLCRNHLTNAHIDRYGSALTPMITWKQHGALWWWNSCATLLNFAQVSISPTICF